MKIISFSNVRKVYMLGKVEIEAVKDASFEIEKGDFVSITGPSGSGKSTILNMIGLIDTPTAGKIIIDDIEIYKDIDYTKAIKSKVDNKITQLRRTHLGFIFQNFNLIPVLNVFENIEFPLLLGSNKNSEECDKCSPCRSCAMKLFGSSKKSENAQSKKERKEWVDYLIEKVGLSDWKNHKPNELSGGQRQRVAVARALVTKTPIIMADEPTANLDSKTGDQILQLMKDLNKEFQTTFIFSTHDAKITKMANHIIRLLDGEIIENVRESEAN